MEEETIISENERVLVCNKGNMLLESYKKNSKKAYILKYDFKNLDPNKVNIKALLGFGTYELLEKINPDLIEKIIILNKLNTNEADICIFLKHIAKDIGIKQKYILFRSMRVINHNNGSIVFNNKDLSLINNEIKEKYLKQLQLDVNKYEPLIFNYGKTTINLSNLDFNELSKLNNNENFNNILNLNFIFDFQILISDDLPIYMENLMGLMFKKIFYNLKQFIDNLNN
tara:strand:- start:2157 stop:2840 length:684 start_codon:yes stop_codon:yes gene_type:complete